MRKEIREEVDGADPAGGRDLQMLILVHDVIWLLSVPRNSSGCLRRRLYRPRC